MTTRLFPMELSWRPMAERDLLDVESLAGRIHGERYHEDPAIFAERLRLFPKGCLMLEARGASFGYGIAYPQELFEIAPLNTLIKSLPKLANSIFVHDIAILEPARGRGFGSGFIRKAEELAANLYFPYVSLVSVNNTVATWTKLGFKPMLSFDAELLSFGLGARYMVKPLRGFQR